MTKSKIIGFIGIGIFGWLGLQGLCFILKLGVKEMLLFTSLSPMLIYSISEYLYLIGFLLGFWLLLKKLPGADYFSENRNVYRVFLLSVLLVVLTQLTQVAIPFIMSEFGSDYYLDLRHAYFSEIGTCMPRWRILIDNTRWVLEYGIAGLIIAKYLKSKANLNPIKT